jgi:UDP-N-acetyl-D-mannosaminuronic acid dehydrogenase
MPASTSFEHDVCIVGTGRVGLPLGLSLVDVGLRVVGVDVDPALREAVNGGVMPFKEPGYDELVASRKLRVEATPEVIARAAAVVITVGTPLHTHIETDLRQIQKVLASIAPHLREGQLVCMRSTVAPGTTKLVRGWIERNTSFKVGETIFLAFCPERIAEGQAKRELRELAQIVGAEDERSREMARALWGHLTPDLLDTDFVSAELVKLFNNISRYVHFAVANQFAIIADTFGANIYKIRELANFRYPRSNLAMPGFTAGTCLRKDFGMISEWNAYSDLLLSAWKVNEFMPAFLVQHLRQRFDIADKRVALLGYTFKAETDDVRDSLAPKLLRYIERELPKEVRVCEPHLGDPTDDPINGKVKNWSIQEALDGVDAVFVATNHAVFKDALRGLAAARPEAWVADLWNVTGHGEVFYRAGDLGRG